MLVVVLAPITYVMSQLGHGRVSSLCSIGGNNNNHSGAGVFGLIGCISLSPSLALLTFFFNDNNLDYITNINQRNSFLFRLINCYSTENIIYSLKNKSSNLNTIPAKF